MVLTSVDARRELQRRAAEELARRREDPSYTAEVVQALRAHLFDKQLEVLDDPAPKIAMCCSRRAGKSELSAHMLAIALLSAGYNEHVLFAARTLQKAKNIIWLLMVRINEQYSLGWKCQEHIGEITTTKGARLTLLGVDDAVAVEKVRGQKYRLAVCDEASTYEELLNRLVVDCLEPGTMDFDPPGRIVLAGTPGYAMAGYWYEVATGKAPGWSSHYWTLHDNPHIKNVEEKLQQLRESRGWAEDEPTYRREYLGHWVADESALVFSFDERRNTTNKLPEPPEGMAMDDWIREEWLTTVSADIGYTDAFGLVALGSPPHSQDIYVLYTFKQSNLIAGEQSEHIKEARERFRPQRTVADIGGQGKLVVEEFNRRFGAMAGGPILAATKMGKVEAIGMFNSDMRLGRIKAWLPHTAAICTEWSQLPWATEEKRIEHKAFENHLAMCALYAWRMHKSFLAKPAAPPKTEADLERERVAQRNREAAAALKRRR